MQIDALCLFDMVSSMGWSVLARRASEDVVANIPTSMYPFTCQFLIHVKLTDDPALVARKVFHAVALWETRAHYVTTLMRHGLTGRLIQVGFPGGHGNCGWMDRKGSNPLIMGPLAWMIDQLSSIGIKFDKQKLERRFAPRPTWFIGKVAKPRFIERFAGLVAPTPGRIIDPQGALPIQVHYSARFRTYRRRNEDPAMPGYDYFPRLVGSSWQWHLLETSPQPAQTGQPGEATMPAHRAPILYEAPIGELEDHLRQLLGPSTLA